MHPIQLHHQSGLNNTSPTRELSIERLRMCGRMNQTDLKIDEETDIVSSGSKNR